MAVYYFSPTGTSRRVAKALGPEAIDLTLPDRRRNAPRPMAGELFTLIFPSYGQRVPGPLRDWLKGFPAVDAPACILCTYGSVSAGAALAEAAGLLARAGMTVTAAAELPGPHCYDCGETGRDLTGAGETDLAEAADFYRRVLAKEPKSPVNITPRWDAARLLPDRLAPVRLGVPRPGADHALCTRCGACQAVCPTGAAAYRAVGCIRCGACVRACSTGARKLRFRTQFVPWFLSKTIQKRPPRFIL